MQPKCLNRNFVFSLPDRIVNSNLVGAVDLLRVLWSSCFFLYLEFGLSTDGIGPVSPNKFISKVNFMEELVSTIIGDYVLVAPSMSGAYAIPFALTQPKRMAGLVLVAPAASDTVPQRKLKNLQVKLFLVYSQLDKASFSVKISKK